MFSALVYSICRQRQDGWMDFKYCNGFVWYSGIMLDQSHNCCEIVYSTMKGVIYALLFSWKYILYFCQWTPQLRCGACAGEVLSQCVYGAKRDWYVGGANSHLNAVLLLNEWHCDNIRREFCFTVVMHKVWVCTVKHFKELKKKN